MVLGSSTALMFEAQQLVGILSEQAPFTATGL